MGCHVPPLPERLRQIVPQNADVQRVVEHPEPAERVFCSTCGHEDREAFFCPVCGVYVNGPETKHCGVRPEREVNRAA